VNLPPLEAVLAAVIVGVLLLLASYYGWQQWRVLAGLKHSENMLPEDRLYHRTHARRVLTCSALMVILAGMVAGWYLSGSGARLSDLAQSAENQGENAPRQFDPQEKGVITFSAVYWIVAFLLLLGIGCLALVDLWAVRRFGLRHMRQIQADRRAMLERQLALRRTDRNGHQN
jgi:hypothetical protein